MESLEPGSMPPWVGPLVFSCRGASTNINGQAPMDYGPRGGPSVFFLGDAAAILILISVAFNREKVEVYRASIQIRSSIFSS